MNGGTKRRTPQAERNPRRTWFNIMNEVRYPRKRNQDVPPNRGECPDADQVDEEKKTSELNTIYHNSPETNQADNPCTLLNNLVMTNTSTSTIHHNPKQNQTIYQITPLPRQP